VTTTLASSVAGSTFQIGEQPRHGSLALDGDQLTYNPDPQFTGSDSFSYTATTPAGVVSPPSVGVISVLPSGSPPVVDPVPTLTGPEASAPVSARGERPDELRLTLAGLPGFVTLSDLGSGNGVVTLDTRETDRTPGTYTGSLVATDSVGSASSSVTVVVPGNASPVVDSLALTTPIDSPVTGTFTALDSDGDDLTVAVQVAPQNGTVTQDGFAFTYTPAAGFTGKDGFIVEVSDGTTTRSAAAVVDVLAVSEAGGGGATPIDPTSPGAPPSVQPEPGSPAGGGGPGSAPTADAIGGTAVLPLGPESRSTASASGVLAWTGAVVGPWAALGAAALIVGAVLTVLGRRRRS
jgi:hypothetical protein